MTEGPDEPTAATPTDDLAAVRADIEATRAELASTIDALSAKANVPARARGKIDDLGQAVSDKASELKQHAPDPLVSALDTAGAKAAPAVHAAADQASANRGRIAAGAALAALVLIVVRRRRRRR